MVSHRYINTLVSTKNEILKSPDLGGNKRILGLVLSFIIDGYDEAISRELKVIDKKIFQFYDLK